MRSTHREGKFVYKTDDTLDDKWKHKLFMIMEVINIPAFVKFIPGGYVTKYIDGMDLQEDTPFNYRHDIVRAYPLNPLQRKRVIRIFKKIVYAGIVTGYTLADFTKRNIIMKKNTPYLIDYDVIVIGELNRDYINIFQTMLNYLKIKYIFNGNLHELYKHL